MMESEEVLKSGSLYVPPQGFLKQKKSWHKKYYVLYKASRQGIQRLEVFENEDQYLKQNNCTRIIALTDCLKVSISPQKQQSNVFEIRTKESTHLFSSDTFQEMTEWLNCLQFVAFGNYSNGSPSVSTKSLLDSNANQFNNSDALSMRMANSLSEAQSEENLLYSSVDAPDVYRVKLIDSDASVRCGLKNNLDSYFTLIITSVSISLAEDGKVSFTWPFRHIRRYGCTKDGFSLEAGRKCASGDGLFSFITKDGNSIFHAVATHVNSLKISRSLTDDQIPGITSLGASNSSPQLKHKETLAFQNHSYFNNETKPSLPSTSPPNSSNYLSKSGYFATNSSLLPSSKLPEPTKRHSIQPPKSPKMIPKTALTRVTSVSTATTTVLTNAFSNNEPKLKPSPPISKPPRKSKESKPLDSDEPVFASREEVLGLNSETSHFDFSGSYKPINDEILYDEPGDITTHSINPKDEQTNKTPFCPSPPPVNQTVSKLTSVLKMMFSGNQVHPKYYKDNKRHVSASSSSGSSGKNSVSSPIVTNFPEKIDSINELAYAQVSVLDINKSDNNQLSDNNKDSNHYSKILNTSSQSSPTNYIDHEYANIECNDLNKPIDNMSHTEHYVQNDCEYARVVKRTINTSSLERKN